MRLRETKIQAYVPAGLLDTAHKLNNEYIVFDPVAKLAVPAYTNAQRLGVGAPVIADIIREVIIIQKKQTVPKKPRKEPEAKW